MLSTPAKVLLWIVGIGGIALAALLTPPLLLVFAMSFDAPGSAADPMGWIARVAFIVMPPMLLVGTSIGAFLTLASRRWLFLLVPTGLLALLAVGIALVLLGVIGF